MAEKTKPSAQGSAQKPKKVIGVPFTPMTAKQAQEASARARSIRKQVQAQMLDTLVTNMDFGKEILAAMKSGDEDKINRIEKCLHIVGLHYKDSEEAVQKIALDAKTDNRTDTTVHFTLGKKPEAAPEE